MKQSGSSVHRDAAGGRGAISTLGRFVLPVFALAVAVTLVYGGVAVRIFDGQTPGMYDVHRYFTPMAYLLDASLHNGEVPLWNPLSFCGAPFAANPQTALYYPLQAIRSAVTVSPTPMKTYIGLTLVMGLQLLGLALGTFWLARDYRLSRPAAYLAGITVVSSQLVVRRALALHFVSALVTVPLILLCINRAVNATSRRRLLFYSAGAGIFWGVSVLSGFLQIQIYIVPVIAIHTMMTALLRPRRAQGPILARFRRAAACLALTLAIGAGVSAAMVVPAAEFAGMTARAKDASIPSLEGEVGDLWFLLKGIVAEKDDLPLAAGFTPVGLAPLLLALLACSGIRRREALGTLVLLLAMIDCSADAPFPLAWVVKTVSPFQAAYPLRALFIAALPLALLAGFGADALGRPPRDNRARWIRTALLVAVGAFLAAFEFTKAHPEWLARSVACLSAGVILLAVLATWRGERSGVIVASLPILVLAQLLVVNIEAAPGYLKDLSFYSIQDTFQGPSRATPPNTRAIEPRPNAHLCTRTPSVNGYDPLCLRSTYRVIAPPGREDRYMRVVDACHLVDTSNLVSGSLLKRRFWLVRQCVDGPLPPKDRPFPPTTTAFVPGGVQGIPSAALEDVPRRWASEDSERIDATAWLAPARMVPSPGMTKTLHVLPFPETMPSGMHTIVHVGCTVTAPVSICIAAYLRDDPTGHIIATCDRTPSDAGASPLSVVLPDAPLRELRIEWSSSAADSLRIDSVTLSRDRADEDGLIDVRHIGMNSALLDVGPLPAPRMLVFLDAAYPGWRAYLDDAPAPILTADDTFKAVVVPAGRHEVRFEFAPRRVAAGMAISSATLVAVCGVLAWCALTAAHTGIRREEPDQ